MQKIVTDGNGLKIPIVKLKKSVTEVMVMETAASPNISAILWGTGVFMDVLLQAASMTNVSSIPTPKCKKKSQMSGIWRQLEAGNGSGECCPFCLLKVEF